MNRYDRPRPPGYSGGDGRDVDVVGVRFHIDEYRRPACVKSRVCGRDPCKGRNDHLVPGFKTKRRDCEVQGRGAAGYGDRVPRTDLLRKGLLERCDLGPLREPTGFKNFAYCLQLLLPDARTCQRNGTRRNLHGHVLPATISQLQKMP